MLQLLDVWLATTQGEHYPSHAKSKVTQCHYATPFDPCKASLSFDESVALSRTLLVQEVVHSETGN
jgi:hypothetical protein